MKVLTSVMLMLACSESASILGFFPVPVPSHHFIFRSVMEQLANRGHQILYVTAYPYQYVPDNIEQIDLSKYEFKQEFENFDFIGFSELSIPMYTEQMYQFGLIMAKYYIASKEVQELINSNQEFDAVLLESYFYQEYLSALIHKFNAIGIEIMTLGDCAWVNELSGVPDNPAYQLDFKSALTSDMSFWQRLYNVYVTAITTISNYYYLHFVMQPAMDTYLNYTGWEGRPPIDVLAKNRSLILTNFNTLFGYPYPTAPHRKDIGAINIRPNKPLPQDLQTFMDDSMEGVIYMSLGSHMNSSVIKNEMDSFMSVFRTLPQRVLMKFDTDYASEIPTNVKISNWFPQQDILAHKNCVLFITHGGLLSISEATYHAVPLVGIPFFADQAKNVIFVESEGFGRLLRFRNITRDTVSWTVREILTNSRYKKEAVRRSKILRDARYTPAEEAVYWIEHSLKYPFALTPKSASLSAVQLHLIDIKLFILSLLVAIIYVLYMLLKLFTNIILKSKLKHKIKSN